MDREQAKNYIRENPEQYLQKDNSGKGYICPMCSSGTGKNGTGMTTKDGIHFTCWSCNDIQNNDIIDIIGIENQITDTREIFNKAYEIYGIEVDENYSNSSYDAENDFIFNDQDTQSSNNTHRDNNDVQQSSGEDYTSLFLEANKNLHKTNYLMSRGLTTSLANKFNLGFIEDWSHPKSPYYKKPVLIIPTDKDSYLARDIRKDIPEKEKKYSKMKVGKSNIFNIKALDSNTSVFIVEGEIDALSIEELGYKAIALGSTTNINKFISHLENNKIKLSNPLILAMDNDKAGKEAALKLQGLLKEKGYTSFIADDLYKDEKDANALLLKDRAILLKDLTEWVYDPETKFKEAAMKEYEKNSAANYINDFLNGIKESVNTQEISTGFPVLDTALEGGLYEGLYILGAISSLGKTTFLLQMADQLAGQGNDVLIISLEMARSELMSKSISRHTIMNCLNLGLPTSQAKTNLGISVGKRYVDYSDDEKELIKKSVADYSQYARNLYILEGLGDIGVKQIRETVEKHTQIKGKPPILIVDYLQILGAFSDRMSDKQNADYNVRELKRISRDFKTPVLCISSFNRENYKSKVGMQSFKESGGIEYSSDVLLGMQLEGVGTSEFDVDKAKDKNPREVELVVLKNRNGKSGNKVGFNYYPMFNYFKEC